MGLNDYKPEFRLIANAADISTRVRDRLVSLTIIDGTGMESDTLEIAIANDNQTLPIRKPPRGAELQIELGYNGQLHKMGRFIVDEVSMSGLPDVMTIRARAAPFEESTTGALPLQAQKSRTWELNTTIQALVATIAREHGLFPLVSSSLSAALLPALYQTAESDVSFLIRVSNQYDAMVKVAGGLLAFLKRGEQKRADGSPMPTIVINRADITHFDFIEASRDDVGTVVAFWHSKAQAKREQVAVGSGDPVKQLRNFYGDEQAAKAAAEATLDRMKRGRATFSVTLPGNATLSAENSLELRGFHPDIPTSWLVTQVTHRLSSRGYSCDVAAVLPNDPD